MYKIEFLITIAIIKPHFTMADGVLFGFNIEEFLIVILIHAFAKFKGHDAWIDYTYEPKDKKVLLEISEEESVSIDFEEFTAVKDTFDQMIYGQLTRFITPLGMTNLSNDCRVVEDWELETFEEDYPITYYWDTESCGDKDKEVAFYSRGRFLGQENLTDFPKQLYKSCIDAEPHYFEKFFPTFEDFDNMFISNLGEISKDSLMIWT